MTGMIVKRPAKSAVVTAVIIRADGTREYLGTISYWHRNPIRRWAWMLAKFIRGLSK